MPEVEAGVGNGQCLRDCLSLRMDQNHFNLLSPCKLLLFCCIIHPRAACGPIQGSSDVAQQDEADD